MYFVRKDIMIRHHTHHHKILCKNEMEEGDDFILLCVTNRAGHFLSSIKVKVSTYVRYQSVIPYSNEQPSCFIVHVYPHKITTTIPIYQYINYQ